MTILPKVTNLYSHWEKYSVRPGEQEIKEVALDSLVEQKFWDWAHERMSIFYKKDAGLEFPWTEDEILKKNFFTNCYRELDKTTIAIHEWLLPVRGDLPLLFLNILYARFCGKLETLYATGLLDKDLTKIPQNMQTYQNRPEGQRVTSAYLFPIAGALKIGVPGRPEFFYDFLPKNIDSIVTPLLKSEDKGILELINEIVPYIGFNAKFHLTEALMDLGYIRPELINETKPLYVGPGAVPTCLALNSKAKVEQVVYTLMKHQPEEFNHLQINGKKVFLTACAIEQILCEVRKYENLKAASGRQRIYRK